MLSAEMKARVRRVLERRRTVSESLRTMVSARGEELTRLRGSGESRRIQRVLDLWVAELSFVIENAGLFIYKKKLEEMSGLVPAAAPFEDRRPILVSLRDSIARAMESERPAPDAEMSSLMRQVSKHLDELGELTDNVGEVLIGESGGALLPELDGYEPIPEADTVFVIMSFMADLQEIYELAMESAINKCGLEAYRVDREEPVYHIAQEILDKISRAKLVIADLTYERQNCYYELGFARGRRKRIILTCRSDHDPRRAHREEVAPKVHFDVDSQKITYWSPNDVGQFRRDLILRVQNMLRA